MTDNRTKPGHKYDAGFDPAHSDPSERFLYPHAARYAKHLDDAFASGAAKTVNVELPIVARYCVDNINGGYKEFAATYSGRIRPYAIGATVTSPVYADRQVKILAVDREHAEQCAEHIARDESWCLIGLKEC